MKRSMVALMDTFPDFRKPGFNVEQYNQQFRDRNIVIHAFARQVSYPEHWGGLSVKCAFGGQEFYRTSNGFYAVDDRHFLLFNEGRYYSSFIESENEVESFTVNFTPEFQSKILGSLSGTDSTNLDAPFHRHRTDFHFTERLMRHGSSVSPLLLRLKELSTQWSVNIEVIKEQLHLLFEELVFSEENTRMTQERLKAKRAVTRRELFERLHRVRDYLYSCYQQNVSLEDMAGVACLNSYYLIRQFKMLFQVTPHQFLQQIRMEKAEALLRTTPRSVEEICLETGFIDPSSFSKLFKRSFGLPPHAYRRSLTA